MGIEVRISVEIVEGRAVRVSEEVEVEVAVGL